MLDNIRGVAPASADALDAQLPGPLAYSGPFSSWPRHPALSQQEIDCLPDQRHAGQV
jgi:hypothetical protein